ncbi:class I SAM-dependent methyltransferase [Candidatus Gottesmanbacteria bacterium]|nr:class I SAM-dependent methyltransferase [Candidatus Gottesmanbacteria bacterium]
MKNLFEYPFIYNLRFLVAGQQEKTKKFIIENYKNAFCKSVIDIGCGTGDFCTLFNPDEYLGVDINKKYIDFAIANYPSYKFLQSNILKHNLNHKSYDASILVGLLHHLTDSETKTMLGKIVKGTKKIIIVVDLNPYNSLIKRLLIDIDRGKYVRTTSEKIKLLTKFGKIQNINHFSTRLASQTGIIVKPNNGS